MKGGPSRSGARSGWVGVVRANTAMSRRCPKCEARPGWRCTRKIGDRVVFKVAPCAERFEEPS